MSITTAKYEICAGLLLRDRIRRLLSLASWMREGLEWKEDKGFLESTFYIRGPFETVEDVVKMIQGELDLSER